MKVASAKAALIVVVAICVLVAGLYISIWLSEQRAHNIVASVHEAGGSLQLVDYVAPAPPAEENGADELQSILSDLGELLQSTQQRCLTDDELWEITGESVKAGHLLKQQQSCIDEYLRMYEPVLTATEDILGRFSKFNFFSRLAPEEAAVTLHAYEAYAERNRILIYLVRLFALRAKARASEGASSEGLQDCVLILKVADTVADEPASPTQLMRSHWHRIAVQCAEFVIQNGALPSADMLATFSDACEHAVSSWDLTWLLEVTRAEDQLWFQRMRDPLNVWSFPDWPSPVVDYEGNTTLVSRRKVVTWHITYLQKMNRLVRISDLPYEQILAEAEDIRDWVAARHQDGMDLARSSVYSSLRLLRLVPATRASLQTAAVSSRVAAQLLIADREPDQVIANIEGSLLADPFSGGTLHWLVKDEQILVYSIGFDLDDDGGTIRSYTSIPKDWRPDDYGDIGFSIPLKQKEVVPKIGAVR